jgi:hypothetical protein
MYRMLPVEDQPAEDQPAEDQNDMTNEAVVVVSVVSKPSMGW